MKTEEPVDTSGGRRDSRVVAYEPAAAACVALSGVIVSAGAWVGTAPNSTIQMRSARAPSLREEMVDIRRCQRN